MNDNRLGGPRLSRRQAIRLLGGGAGLAFARTRARPALAMRLRAVAKLTFPQGAIICTILADVPADALEGGATLFHEHLSLGGLPGTAAPNERPPRRYTENVELMREELRAAAQLSWPRAATLFTGVTRRRLPPPRRISSPTNWLPALERNVGVHLARSAPRCRYIRTSGKCSARSVRLIYAPGSRFSHTCRTRAARNVDLNNSKYSKRWEYLLNLCVSVTFPTLPMNPRRRRASLSPNAVYSSASTRSGTRSETQRTRRKSR